MYTNTHIHTHTHELAYTHQDGENGNTFSFAVKRVSAPSAFARYNFKSSSLSAIGHHCALEPKTGTALQTRFSVHCSGAVREHHPLSYTVYAMTDDSFGVGEYNACDKIILGIIISTK